MIKHTWWRGRPTIDGKTARGASSPAKPALHMPEPLSITRAATSSSHILLVVGYWWWWWWQDGPNQSDSWLKRVDRGLREECRGDNEKEHRRKCSGLTSDMHFNGRQAATQAILEHTQMPQNPANALAPAGISTHALQKWTLSNLIELQLAFHVQLVTDGAQCYQIMITYHVWPLVTSEPDGQCPVALEYLLSVAS